MKTTFHFHGFSKQTPDLQCAFQSLMVRNNLQPSMIQTKDSSVIGIF